MQRGVLLIVLGLACAAWRQPASADVSAVPARMPAPALSLRDANGTPIALADFKGEVVLLDFWATWCTGCKVEIPWYIDFQKKYSRRGFVSVGVAMDEEGWQKVKPYLAQHPINYPIVIGDAELARRFNVTALPVTLLIDRAGRIADAHAGMVVKDAWEQEIQTLLREPR